jgi:hypothetical protein
MNWGKIGESVYTWLATYIVATNWKNKGIEPGTTWGKNPLTHVGTSPTILTVVFVKVAYWVSADTQLLTA